MTRTAENTMCSPDAYVTRRVRMFAGALLSAAAVLAWAWPGTAFAQNNTRASDILGMFDINGAGGADESPDTDGDGLPDTWEVGGLDVESTEVPFPAPDAIVPGTAPTSIFSRRPVRTSATARDTDGDGLSDFIEVFGLKFIDDDGDGILDDALRLAAGDPITFAADGTPLQVNPDGEWFDFNEDGMPSIGEYPARNVLITGATDNYDFDGFVFTDPSNADTDGDGSLDGADNDPLVNPRAFGEDRAFFSSGATGSLAQDEDFDNDGLGNGLDLGRDVDGRIDNPTDLERVIQIFRPDLLTRADDILVPEGLIEDLLGADWNGDGLFRLTDLKDPHFGVVSDLQAQRVLTAGATNLFEIDEPGGVAGSKIPLGYAFETNGVEVVTAFPSDDFRQTVYYDFDARGVNGVNPPLPYQELLVPAGREDNVFLPDPRIWTVLYAWRMPGFDIDGNGFIGFDGASFRGSIEVNGVIDTFDTTTGWATQNPPSSELPIAAQANPFDGAIDAGVSIACPLTALIVVALALVGVIGTRSRR